jgi:hypothetical protein
MIEIAGEEERLKNQGVQQTIQAPQAVQAQPGVAEQFGNMAKQRVMEGALNKGSAALASKATEAGLMNSAGALTGMGAAMPYVGAGILAGKALGFFNNGGHVGPLYASKGRKTPEGKSIADQIKYLEDKEYYEGLDRARDDYFASQGIGIVHKSGGGPLYAAQGDQAEDEGMLESIARKLKSAKNYVMGEDRKGSDASSFLKGEGVNYNAMGGMMGPLASVKYKSAGGEIEYKYK